MIGRTGEIASPGSPGLCGLCWRNKHKHGQNLGCRARKSFKNDSGGQHRHRVKRKPRKQGIRTPRTTKDYQVIALFRWQWQRVATTRLLLSEDPALGISPQSSDHDCAEIIFEYYRIPLAWSLAGGCFEWQPLVPVCRCFQKGLQPQIYASGVSVISSEELPRLDLLFS